MGQQGETAAADRGAIGSPAWARCTGAAGESSGGGEGGLLTVSEGRAPDEVPQTIPRLPGLAQQGSP